MTQYSEEQLALKAHIEAENATAQSEGQLFTTVDELDHWAEYGVYNIAQYQRHCAIATFIDVYKEINGIKPRWMNFDPMTTEAIEAEVTRMLDAEEKWQEQCQRAEEEALAERKRNNTYRPNNPFADLKSMMSS